MNHPSVKLPNGRSRRVRCGVLPTPRPSRVWQIDSSRLAPARDGTHYNASLVRHQGRLLLAYRTDRGGSDLHVAELGGGMTPGESVSLRIRASHCACGREDPRLFTFRGQLHVGFVGVCHDGQGVFTNQLYASLRDDLSVERIHAPRYAARQRWEKNWMWFEWRGELMCVYSATPHLVLHAHREGVYPFAESSPELPWAGGLLRGGTPPVLVGDEYWTWFHGRRLWQGLTVYTAGVYAFAAEPPFRPTRITPRPVIEPDRESHDRDRKLSVVYPCGAVLEDGRWLVSYGVHDQRIEVAEFDHSSVERAMVKV